MRQMVMGFVALAWAGAALAQQAYPARPMRMVVPWPPGQATDVTGRLIAQKLAEALVRAGRLKAYGVSLARSSPITPGIEPLARTANLPGFDISGWIGVMVAAATPRPIVHRLSSAIDTIMRLPEAREKLAALDVDVDYRPPEEFARDLKFQQMRFGEIIKKGNIRID